jgi:hypothetical protein
MTDSTQALLCITKSSDLDTILYHLLKYTAPGAQQYLINLLFNFPLKKVSFYIPQLINIAVQRESYSSFDAFFYDAALMDHNVGMKIFWYLQSYSQDGNYQSAKTMIIHLERIFVAGNREINNVDTQPGHFFDIEGLGEDSDLTIRKLIRGDYHMRQDEFVNILIRISEFLINERIDTETYLQGYLCNVNAWLKDLRLYYTQDSFSPYTKRLFRGLVLPFDLSNYPEQIVSINSEYSKCFRTKSRVPYLVIFETVDINEEADGRESIRPDPHKPTIPEMLMSDTSTAEDISDQSSILSESNYEYLTTSAGDPSNDSPWGEPWTEFCLRLKQASLFGHFSSWKARGVIVKSNDDLRQELLAMQLINKCSEIFTREKLALWLRPYNILVTSNNSGIIEYIPNAISIHSLKKRNQDCKNLAEVFEKCWKHNIEEIKTNFVQSMAGYSLISYILNLKDRHNGNILIDSQGHVVHIDFGFFLTNSPGGNFGFETAPFKLTKEMIDIMGGYNDEMFLYYQILIYQGFIALRKYFAELVLILEMMLPGQHLPCIQDPLRAVKDFKMRFFITLTEEQVLETVKDLVNTAAEHWKTTQYDYFQKTSNSIL